MGKKKQDHRSNRAEYPSFDQLKTGKMAQVATEMPHYIYTLSLLGISQSKWTQTGQSSISTGELLPFTGHEEDDATHTEGVAFMPSRAAQTALIGYGKLMDRNTTASRTNNHHHGQMQRKGCDHSHSRF